MTSILVEAISAEKINLYTKRFFFFLMNNQKEMKKDGASIFVASMLQSAQENKEAAPQTRNDVDPTEIDKIMANIQKGLIRK